MNQVYSFDPDGNSESSSLAQLNVLKCEVFISVVDFLCGFACLFSLF